MPRPQVEQPQCDNTTQGCRSLHYHRTKHCDVEFVPSALITMRLDSCTEGLRAFSAVTLASCIRRIATQLYEPTDFFKEIIRQTQWITAALMKTLNSQVSKSGVLFAFFAVNVNEEIKFEEHSKPSLEKWLH